MSASESPTTVSYTASQTNLFPSSTRSASADTSTRSTNVYYLVFLGVLVILLLLAACLAFRAFRIRRRYRTATQLALARGGPLPNDPRNEFWGLGGFPGWFPDGDRIETQDGRSGRKGKTRWQKIPILWESEVEVEEDLQTTGSTWKDNLPIMLASRREVELEETTLPVVPVPETSSPTRSPFSMRFGRNRGAYQQPAPPAPPPRRQREIDREVEDDEDVRMAVIIRMPFEDSVEPRRRIADSDAGSLDEEEEDRSGWMPGMELGVWDGHVEDPSYRYR